MGRDLILLASLAAFANAASAAEDSASMSPTKVAANLATSQKIAAQEPNRLSPMPPDEPPALTLTWADCVALAAKQNPSLASAEYAEKAGQYTYYSSYNGLLPTMALTNTYTHNNNVGGVAVGAQGFYTAQAAISMNLFNMSSVASIRSAKASYNQSLASQRNASATLRANLLNAFANVYFNQVSLEMTRRIDVIQRKNAEEVTLRYDSGNEYKGNMMNAKAQALVQDINVAQAVRNLRASIKTLDQYLGIDEFSIVTVTGTLVAQTPPDLPSHLQDFLENRPDVALQEAVVQTAKASLASSQAPLYPNLSVNYSRFREGGSEFPNNEYLWSSGATLSWPIFGGGPASAYFNVKSAKSSLFNQQSALRAVRDAAIANLENAWASYANAVDQAVGEQAVLESYRQRNDEAEVRYASGLVSFDNWQVIVSQWVGAEQTSINNWQAAVTAQAAWEQALGKALGE
jgi:outer membrane protein TolC